MESELEALPAVAPIGRVSEEERQRLALQTDSGDAEVANSMPILGIRYLCGWSMAKRPGRLQDRMEWPPHPDRDSPRGAGGRLFGDIGDGSADERLACWNQARTIGQS